MSPWLVRSPLLSSDRLALLLVPLPMLPASPLVVKLAFSQRAVGRTSLRLEVPPRASREAPSFPAKPSSPWSAQSRPLRLERRKVPPARGRSLLATLPLRASDLSLLSGWRMSIPPDRWVAPRPEPSSFDFSRTSVSLASRWTATPALCLCLAALPRPLPASPSMGASALRLCGVLCPTSNPRTGRTSQSRRMPGHQSMCPAINPRPGGASRGRRMRGHQSMIILPPSGRTWDKRCPRHTLRTSGLS
mgnify:CR=1 FL=1